MNRSGYEPLFSLAKAHVSPPVIRELVELAPDQNVGAGSAGEEVAVHLRNLDSRRC